MPSTNLVATLQTLPPQEQYTLITAKIIECRNQAAKSIFEMGEWLCIMRESKLYQHHYQTFEEYVWDACRIGKSEAYNYIRFYEDYVQSGLLEQLDAVLDKVRVTELAAPLKPSTAEDSPATVAAQAVGIAKLNILSDVMRDKRVPVEEKATWLYRALQEPDQRALKRLVVQEYRIPKGGKVIPSCFTCAHTERIPGGSRLGEFVVGSKGITACRKHNVLVDTLSQHDAQQIVEGAEDYPGCPSYTVSPEWRGHQ